MPPTAAGRHLALADRVEDAATVFGPLHDDVELSSYAAWEAGGPGHDDALLDSVGMVAGAGLEPALRRTLARRTGGSDAPTILLGLPADLDGIEQVRDLAETLGLALRTEVSTDDGVVLRVCPDAEPQPWEPPAPGPAATGPSPAAPDVAPSSLPGRDEEPASPTVQQTDPPPGASRTRQLALLAGLGVAAVLAVAVVLLVAVGTGAAVVLLLLALLLAVGVTAGLVLVVLRRLAALEQTLLERLPDAALLREQETFRRQVRNRTHRIEQRQQRAGQRARERFEATTAGLQATGERVTALSALTARLAARGTPADDGESPSGT